MYSLIKTLHSSIAWITLILIIIAIITALISVSGKKNLSGSNFKMVFYAFIVAHIQLLLGLILYFVSPNGFSSLSSETMKDSSARLVALEHPLINIIAIILITIGYIKAKKALDNGNAGKTVLLFYTIALVLLLSRIPWSLWLNM
jgi:uncharacterized membrane protein